MYYEERWIDGKFCWRTSPNGAWTAYTANELAHRYQAELQRAHDAQRALDALQAQLADRDAMILQMGEQAAVLAKENMAVKAQLRQVEGERDRLKDDMKERFKTIDQLDSDLTALQQLVEALINTWVNGRKIHDGIPLTLQQQIDATLAAQDAGKEDVSHD